MILYLTILLSVLQALDVATTAHALRNYTGAEGNPVAAKAIKALGIVPGLLAVKAVLMGPIIYIAYTQQYTAALTVLSAVYIAIVVNNIIIIKKD